MATDRRKFLSAGLAALSGTAIVANARAADKKAPAKTGAKAARRRNVLLIISDDQGRDLGCYGGKIRTPALDRLAAEGTLFTQAYATVSSCSPSRSTLYTGLYSHTNGMYGLAHDVHNFSLLDEVTTLPAMLQQAGYATALVGKKHVKPEPMLPYEAWLAPEQPGNRDVAFMAREAGRWLRAKGNKPFFLTVGYSDPHRAAVNFGNTRDWPDVKRERYSPADVVIPSHLPDLPAIRDDLAEYYESVSRLDSGIDLLLQELAAAGHADDTLVIYLSDNGRPFPAGKDTLYREGIHLPLIVRAPGQREAGVRNDAMVSWIDIVPTILDWAKVAVTKSYRYAPLPGRSLLPILEQRNVQGWDRVFTTRSFHEINQYYPIRGVRTRQFSYFQNLDPNLTYPVAGDIAQSPSWKAIQSTPGVKLGRRTLEAYLRRPAEELYDLAADPDELVNVAADPKYATVLANLRSQLNEWRTATHDPWQTGITNPFGHAH